MRFLAFLTRRAKRAGGEISPFGKTSPPGIIGIPYFSTTPGSPLSRRLGPGEDLHLLDQNGRPNWSKVETPMSKIFFTTKIKDFYAQNNNNNRQGPIQRLI